MIVNNRFQVSESAAEFVAGATAVVEHYRACTGNEAAELLQCLDEPQLWLIHSRWANVGSYRRAFNGTEAKLVLLPLLSQAINEPSAFDEPEAVGSNLPRGWQG